MIKNANFIQTITVRHLRFWPGFPVVLFCIKTALTGLSQSIDRALVGPVAPPMPYQCFSNAVKRTFYYNLKPMQNQDHILLRGQNQSMF